MNKQDIQEKVLKARLQRFLNNCYSMDAIEYCTDCWQKDDEFVFSWEDHGIQRLTFFVKDWHALDELLKLIDNGRYFLEFMTKDPQEYIPAGLNRVAGMMRLANADCRSVFESDSPVLQYKDPAIGQQAEEQDVKEINQILWSTFHTEISHLLTDEELEQKIAQFTVHKTHNTIDALLQAEILPKKFYINQIVNKGEKKNIHGILLNKLEGYVSGGGKYLYAWVEDRNIASQKFHQKYGMKHDGMWNMLYCLEK